MYSHGNARILNDLANIYQFTQRPMEAKANYSMMIDIYQELLSAGWDNGFTSCLAVALFERGTVLEMMNRSDEAEAAYEEGRKARANLSNRDLDFSCGNVLGYPFLKMAMARGSVDERARVCSAAVEFVKLDGWTDLKAGVASKAKNPCEVLK